MTLKRTLMTALAFLALSIAVPVQPISAQCVVCSGGQGSGFCAEPPIIGWTDCGAIGGTCIHGGEECQTFAMAVDGTLSSLDRFAVAESPELAETVDGGTVLRRVCDEGVLARAYSVARHDQIRADTRHITI
jgi:hypothetical protein